MSDSTAAPGFDADAKADARSNAPVTIGGRTFHLRRRTWPVALRIRRVIREQERVAGQVDRLSRKLGRLADEEPAAGEALDAFDDRIAEASEELERQIDELVEESDRLAYRLVAVGLHPDGDDPDAEADETFLQEHLAAEEAGALARMVAGAREPDPSPAPTAEATPTT